MIESGFSSAVYIKQSFLENLTSFFRCWIGLMVNSIA